jgi:hypothetical protein
MWIATLMHQQSGEIFDPGQSPDQLLSLLKADDEIR